MLGISKRLGIAGRGRRKVRDHRERYEHNKLWFLGALWILFETLLLEYPSLPEGHSFSCGFDVQAGLCEYRILNAI